MRGTRSLGLALVAAALGAAPAMAQQGNTGASSTNTPPAANSKMSGTGNGAATPGTAANTPATPDTSASSANQNPPAAGNTNPAPAPTNTAANPTPPAPATNTAANPSPPASATKTAANTGSKGPSGALQKYNGDWRSSKLVGATVYNDHGDSVGTIDDLLMDDHGKVATVVISTGGSVLGIGAKLVSVPFDQIKFEPSVNNAAPATAGAPGNAPANSGTAASGSNNKTDYSVVLPGATTKSLAQQSTFKYASTD